jgi:1,2-diacylglycerol 3-alpha-glucosyltransferase
LITAPVTRARSPRACGDDPAGSDKRPIVMITSWPPRPCGIATFAEEAVEFIQRRLPDHPVHIISHTDGRGSNVYPLVDLSRPDWHLPVAEKIKELSPAVVHIQHEYGLYNYVDPHNDGDGNAGFLELLDEIRDYPIVVEPHTVHGRPRQHEMTFLKSLCVSADLVILKCDYHIWRLDWNFREQGWKTPSNFMVIPHGARPDEDWPQEQIPKIKRELGFRNGDFSSHHIVGLLGWIQSNKRWDLLTSIWEETAAEIRRLTGQKWYLFAGGAMRDPAHQQWYELYRRQVKDLQRKGLAHYSEFIPRGQLYYKAMAVCDFVVLPSIDETQSGTLARIISLKKPYITTAPLEGLTSQTVESEGGLLFTSKRMLREKVVRLAQDEQLRATLSNNLRNYLQKVVSWEVVAEQYVSAYKAARRAKLNGEPVKLPLEY